MSSWKLPTSVTVCGQEFAIRSDYRAVLDAISALRDPELSPQEQTLACLEILYPDWKRLPDLSAAAQAAMVFINCGKPVEAAVPKPALVDWDTDAAIMAPDVTADSPEFEAFVKSVVLEITAQAGQTCTAVLLDNSLGVQYSGNVPAASHILRAADGFYLLTDSTVECFNKAGEFQWTQPMDAKPQAGVLNGRQLLVFSGNTVQQVTAPEPDSSSAS